jgi:Putative peptidoglycan binding domain
MNEFEPPGYDDWFDDPEPPTLESGRGSSRPSYDIPAEPEEDVWTLPDDERRSRRGGGTGEIVIGGVALTKNQVAILAVAALAVFIAILAAANVFSSTPAATTQQISTPTTHPTTNTTPTPPAIKVPTALLQEGDTGSQVKLLQKALAAAGYSPGTPDGSFGLSTKNAVEAFQTSQGLTADGVAGPQTLNKLRQYLANGGG